MLETFTATARRINGLQVKTVARDFKITLDEPEELGGTNTGMNPVEAVLCALGACQTIIVSAFAEAKEFQLEDVWVELEGDLDPDGFMGLNPDVRNGFQEIRYTFHLKTNEDEAKTKEFIEFVEASCPVGDIIHNGVPMVRSGIVTE